MIIETKKLQWACKQILFALDKSSQNDMSELVEISTSKNILNLYITNSVDYGVNIPIILDTEVDELKAIVNAKVFLGLISKSTTDTVKIDLSGNTLIIKSNGDYKIPLSTSDKIVSNSLNRINLNNITNSFEIDGKNLINISNKNSKNLLKDSKNFSETLFYLDKDGCITYTSRTGACINKFDLGNSFSILLTEKIVRLFKLFSISDKISFSIANDLEKDLFCQKVEFESIDSKIKITAIVSSDEDLLSKIPATQLKEMSNTVYSNNIQVNTKALSQSIDRLLPVFGYISPFNTIIGVLKFKDSKLIITDVKETSFEEISLPGCSNLDAIKYIDLDIFKRLLDGCDSEFITLSFNSKNGFVLADSNIKFIVPLMKRE